MNINGRIADQQYSGTNLIGASKACSLRLTARETVEDVSKDLKIIGFKKLSSRSAIQAKFGNGPDLLLTATLVTLKLDYDIKIYRKLFRYSVWDLLSMVKIF